MVDVNLKVPVFEKLLDYTASGIGAIAGPMLATWRAARDAEVRRIAARGEADARLIEAKGDAGSLQIIAEAQAEARRRLDVASSPEGGTLEIHRHDITQRIEFQEKKRQQNIVSVVCRAATDVGEKFVADHRPDPDWTARFFGVVQDVSSTDLQEIWARILSGEVQEPGTTSLRTLDILKNMTREDAILFEEVASFAIDGFIYRDSKLSGDDVPMRYGILLHLEECGLLNTGPFLNVNLSLTVREHGWEGIYQDHVLRIQSKDNNIQTVKVPCVSLTSAGTELLRVTDQHFQGDHLRGFARFLRGKKCELFRSRIISRLPGGDVRCYKTFELVEADLDK